mmetsp:Transcript_16786/g.52483  ORF Transcript_16786/g.52483 Transcript_16786/m.52483 type:complete len:239 (+) Transcript_16786:403-1119(+)
MSRKGQACRLGRNCQTFGPFARRPASALPNGAAPSASSPRCANRTTRLRGLPCSAPSRRGPLPPTTTSFTLSRTFLALAACTNSTACRRRPSTWARTTRAIGSFPPSLPSPAALPATASARSSLTCWRLCRTGVLRRGQRLLPRSPKVVAVRQRQHRTGRRSPRRRHDVQNGRATTSDAASTTCPSSRTFCGCSPRRANSSRSLRREGSVQPSNWQQSARESRKQRQRRRSAVRQAEE